MAKSLVRDPPLVLPPPLPLELPPLVPMLAPVAAADALGWEPDWGLDAPLEHAAMASKSPQWTINCRTR